MGIGYADDGTLDAVNAQTGALVWSNAGIYEILHGSW
jgi:hypothetical protein